MPETKFESFIFTVIMTFIMVYAMICYNIALDLGGMENSVFLKSFGELKIMWPAAILLEMLVFEKPVVYLTQRVASKNMSFFAILLIRSSLTVCMMCPSMSLLAAILFKAPQGAELIGVWLQTAAINFPMALAWQIFFGGPAGRLVFRTLFRKSVA
jgi:hypothetical protein